MSLSFRKKCYTQKMMLYVYVCVCVWVCVMINVIHFFVKFVDIFGVMLQKEKDDF